MALQLCFSLELIFCVCQTAYASIAGDAVGRKNLTYEIIIVDDGSKDGTSRIATQYSQVRSYIRVSVLSSHAFY